MGEQGRILAGRYRVEGTLGRGGQGEVLAGVDLRTGAEVALKTTAEGSAALAAELELLARLSHPGLVAVRELLVADGRPWLVTARVRGTPLLEVAAAAGPPASPARVARVLGLCPAVLAALHHLHGRGWCHLDLKPAHVLVTAPDRPVLLDLGLAARSGDLAQGGTAAYAAPELLLGHPIDRRADLYGLGATLLEAAVGAPAREGLERLEPGPGRFLAALLARDRCARPESCAAALSLLGELLGELLGGAPPELPPEQLPEVEGPLRERADALARLARPGVTLITGPAGSGRSRLLREASARRLEAGALTLRVEFGAALPEPYGALAPALTRLGVPVSGPREGVLVAAGRRLLELAAERGGATLAVDDAQAAPPEAREVLAALARTLRARPESEAALWVAWRDEPARDPRWLELAGRGERDRLALAPASAPAPTRPLPEDEEARAALEALAVLARPLDPAPLGRALARARGSSEPAPTSDAFDRGPTSASESRIRPPGVEGAPRAAAAALLEACGPWLRREPGGVALAPGVREQALAHATPARLRAAAALALAALDQGGPPVTAGEELERARLLVRAGEGAARPARVVEAAERGLAAGAAAGARALLEQLLAAPPAAPATRAAAQALLARAALAEGDEPAALRAWAALREDAALPPGARARAAGSAARLLARRRRPAEARALADEAIALAGAPPAGDTLASGDAADAHAPDGSARGAAPDAAPEDLPPAERLELEVDLALVLVLERAYQDPEGFVPDLERLEALRARGASAGGLAALGEALGMALYRANRLEAAREQLARAERDAAAAGEDARRAALLRHLGVVALREGRGEAAARRNEEARAAARLAGDVRGEAEADLEEGLHVLRQGRYRASVARLEAALDVFAALGEAAISGELHMNLGAAWLRLGALEPARRALELAAEDCQDAGLRLFARGDLALLEAHAGRGAAAEAQLAAARAAAAEADAFWRLQAAIQAAAALLVLGRSEEAWREARGAWDEARAAAPALAPAAGITLAEAALAAGGSERAGDSERADHSERAGDSERAIEALAAAEAALAAGQAADAPRAEAARARALAALGRADEALAAARRAVEATGASEDVLDGIAARLALGEALLAAGRAAEAAAVVAPCALAARASGLVRLALEAEALLRAALGTSAAELLEGLSGALAPAPGGASGLLAKVVAGGTDPGHMLDLAIGLLVEATGAERGLLVLLDDEGRPAETAARNIRDEELRGPAFAYSRRLVEAATREQEAVLVPDALSDPRFAEAESVASLAIRSVLAVPVREREREDGPVLAVLYLDDRTEAGRFDPEARELARRLTAELAPAFRLLGDRVRLERDVTGLRSQVREAALAAATAQLVGTSPEMRRLSETIARVARTDFPALIEGESGAGKELVARAIHAASRRAPGPFVGESCAALADSLLERELFGHVRGAFTGADQDRPGIFQAASGGTLFLDEVNSMSASLQAKLLRALQEGVVRPVGAERAVAVDVRVVAASNEPLATLVAAGRFRQDLYYRLAVMPVRVPPLRERPEDVALLVDHFLRKHAPEAPPLVADAALRTLAAYPWPGNVRELENLVRRLLAQRVPRVLVRHLPPEVRAHQKDARPGAEPRLPEEATLADALEALERTLIERALRRTRGNLSQAARALQVERNKLIRRVEALGIQTPRRRRRTS
ncbi:MAG: sigma 54-interacting transcriptional regulator [Planctomycetota bacterium]